MNGKTYTLNYLEDLCQKPQNGGYAAKKYASVDRYGKEIKLNYGNTDTGAAYWYLITYHILPGTRGKGFKDHKATIAQYPGYTIPKMIEVTTGILTEYVRTGNNLYSLYLANNSTYTNCQESTGWWYQNYVGGLSSVGRLFIDCAFLTDQSIGVAAVLRLKAS